MTWQEDAEVVREGLRLGIDPGHPSVYFDALARLTDALSDETFKATEYERLFAEASAALETTERERDALNEEWMAAEARHTESRQAAEQLEKAQTRGTLVRTDETIFARLRASEQRIAELEAALREIVRLHDNATEHFNDLGMAEIARAALEEK